MNKSTFLPQSYVEALPLDAAGRARLSDSLQHAQAFHAIHTSLGHDVAASERPDDAPLKSVSSRVQMAWPDSLADGQQLGKDYLDRTTLKAMPKVTRSLMFPEAWRTNPLARAWDSLRGHKSTARYNTDEEQKAEEKWRHV